MNTNLPILFIPGLLCDQRVWQAQIAYFQTTTNVLVGDITQNDTLTVIAQHILQHAPAEFALAGFSLGGWIALETFRLAPNRVKKLGIISCNDGIISDATKEKMREAIALLEQGKLSEYLESIFPGYVHPTHVNDQALKQKFMQMGMAVGAKAGLNQLNILLSMTGAFNFLHQIHCPTLIVAGEKDQRIPFKASADLANKIPNATLITISNTGHFVPLENPEALNQALHTWYQSR